jgi:hypothetical protein
MKTAVDNRSLSDCYEMPHLYAPFLRSLLSEILSLLFTNTSEVIHIWQKQEHCGKEQLKTNVI